VNIAILSRNAQLYSTRRLKEAAEQREHTVRIVDYLRCVIDITSHRPAIVYGGSQLEGVDAVIPRIGATHTFYGTAVVRQFEMMGVYPPWSPRPSPARATSCGHSNCWPPRGSACP
jgi:ribosomal protein S6--L-glutamate ligase